MIALKGTAVFKIRGVALGAATKGPSAAVVGSKLYFFTPQGTRTFSKGRSVDSWEEGVLGSDGHEVLLIDVDGNLVDTLYLPKHSKVRASPEGLLACGKDWCSFHWWNGQEAWRVSLESPGVPAWFEGHWYVPFKGERIAVVREGQIINEVEGEKCYAARACGKTLLCVSNFGISWFSLKDPEKPERVASMHFPELVFDAYPSPDCSAVAVAASSKLRIVSSGGVFERPYPEVVTAIAWDERLVLGWGEYLKGTVEVWEPYKLRGRSEGAEGVKAIYSFNSKIFKVTENCVDSLCPGSVTSLYYNGALVVAGEKVLAFGEELDVGMAVSVATDGKGALVCTPFSCAYYFGKELLWEVEAKNPVAGYLDGKFIIASKDKIVLVESGRVLKEKRVILGVPKSLSVSGSSAAISFERGTVIVNRDLDVLWALGKGGKVSLSGGLLGLVSRRAEVYPVGDPLPLDLGEGDLALIDKKAYLLKDGKLYEFELPFMRGKPFPLLREVLSVGSEVRGLAESHGTLAVASKDGAFLVREKLKKVWESADDVDSFGKRFVFVSTDLTKILIIDYMANLFKIEIESGYGISEWVRATEEGFLTCGDAGCTFVRWDGKPLWSFPKGASGKPVPFNDGFLVPTPFGVSYVVEGHEVEELELLSTPLSAGRCGEVALVGTEDGLVMVGPGMEVLGEVEGLNFVVSVGCFGDKPVVAEAGGRVYVGKGAFEVEGISAALPERLYFGTPSGLVFKPSLP